MCPANDPAAPPHPTQDMPPEASAPWSALTAGVSLIAAVALIWLLYFTSDVLIPIALALLIWSLVNAIRAGVERVSIAGRHPPGWLAMALSLALIVWGLYEFGALVTRNVQDVIAAAPVYQANIERMLPQLLALIGLEELRDLGRIVEDINVGTLISSIAGTLSGFVGNTAIILIYVMFLLVEQQVFGRKIDAMFRSERRRAEARIVARTIVEQTQNYLRLKTAMCFLTAGVTYVVLESFAVDFAGFWAVVVFLLNYIPTVGSILGAIFPALLALLQFGDWQLALVVLAILGFFAQFVVSNLVEPRFMGSHLNMSPLAIILSLALWGSLWGVAGAFLCVPIMVILMIVTAHFPQTRWIAVLLSNDGDIVENTTNA